MADQSTSSPTAPDGVRRRPVRFGILAAHPTRFPTWQAAAIRALIADGAVPVVVVVPAAGGGAGRGARIAELLRDRRHLLWHLYNKGIVERRSRASRGVDLSEELTDAATIAAHTVPEGRFGESFSDGDVDALAALDLDVILRFGFGIIKGRILDISRWGLWSFHHGDERRYRGRPPGFWELAEGSPVMGTVLQRLTERLDGGVVLYRGTFRTTPHSYLRTRDGAFLGGAEWPALVCRQLLLGGELPTSPSPTDAAIRHNPSNGQMLAFWVRQTAAFVRRQWRGLTSAAIWTIGVADQPIAAFLDEPRPQIRWMPEAGRHRYLADPFAVSSTPDVVLVEDYRHDTHRGVISAVDLTGGSDPTVVLDTGVHASYPFLVEHGGDIWCIPETYQAGEVRLYRAVSYPDRWELTATLVDEPVLDATVIEHEGRWWMFGTRHDDGPDSKLRIWFTDHLAGPWVPHPLNPVKTDVSSSRPAGTPFTKDGALYRPAQNSSESYGGSITINRIEVLSPVVFSETPVASIDAPRRGRYRAGIHTLSAVGSQTVVDGRRDTFSLPAFRREITARLRRLRRR